MANINVQDALLKVAQACKNYTDSNIFSGDYNDLDNKPSIPSIDGLATKEYVDEAIANSPVLIAPVLNMTATGATVIVNNLTTSGTYVLPKRTDEKSWSSLRFQVKTGDGKSLNAILEGYQHFPFVVNVETQAIYLDNLRITYVIGDTADTSSIKSEPYYLGTKNTKEYTPTGDYNPATKKYVDEAIDTDNLVVNNSISMGREEGTTIGTKSVALGNTTTASGENSHAEGNRTTASGLNSHAEGNYTTASGVSSHAEGSDTTANSWYSHAEGFYTTASGVSSHAEGYYTTASNRGSHAEGYYTEASGKDSHAEGNHTTASSENQHVQGKWNVEDTTGTYAHIVGNGTANDTRSNAHTLDWNGNAWFAGNITVGEDNKELATKEYVEESNPIRDYTLLKDQVTNNIYALQMRNGALVTTMVASNIEVASLPNKTEYFQGFEIELDGLQLKTVAADGTESIIDNSLITIEPEIATPGIKTIAIKYNEYGQEYTTSFDITFTDSHPGTYTVESVGGDAYDFVLNSDGYYESTNKGRNDSYALCRVIIDNPSGREVFIDYISSGEGQCDKGVLSDVNTELLASANEDTVCKKKLNDYSSVETGSESYGNILSGVIYVKYYKDVSGSQGRDSLQFKVRFE